MAIKDPETISQTIVCVVTYSPVRDGGIHNLQMYQKWWNQKSYVSVNPKYRQNTQVEEEWEAIPNEFYMGARNHS